MTSVVVGVFAALVCLFGPVEVKSPTTIPYCWSSVHRGAVVQEKLNVIWIGPVSTRIQRTCTDL